MKAVASLILLSSVFFCGLSFGASTELTVSSPVMENDSCLSQEIIDSIKKDFEFTYDDDTSLGSFSLDPCDNKSIQNRIFRGLAFLKYGKFAEFKKSKDEAFFNEFAGVSPYEFLTKRIKSINFTADCDEKVGAYAYHGSHRFYVCVNNFKEAQLKGGDISADFYASVAVHESRHTDADDIGHFTCTQGFIKGFSQGCDQSRQQQGAYHYDVEYSAAIARFGKNFHPAIVSNASARAILGLLNRFNIVPKLKNSTHVLVRDKTGSLIDLQKNNNSVSVGAIHGAKLFSRADGELSIYDRSTLSFSGWSIFSGQGDAKGLYAKEYNEQHSPREPILDVIYGNRTPERPNDGVLEGQNLKYAFYSSQNELLAKGSSGLPFRDPQRFLKSELCHGSNNNFYILAADQHVYEGQLDEQKKVQFKEIFDCNTDFLNVIKFKDQKIGLSADGRLLEMKDNSWRPISKLSEKKFDFLSEPFDLYDFFIGKGQKTAP